ncbi:SemiSWEET family transporter [Terrimonas sp. NA20]|uniref:SemiSWEET family transporter n=1 Tax=Terrimonas ginsenosidimutans TaxID=2908004 RepID=A0ABS9KMK6_9BACT|nr:SemiSWEET family transporter [Terrimonas ginsenosidimutans]MCG2613557.1 SemiSWEET family transporter [Terrimonas ginsenosidimutans]
MQPTQIIGIAAGICTGLSLLPQLIKIRKEKKANSMSPATLIFLLVGLAGWIIYGTLRDDYPVIITNLLSFVTNLWIICLSIKYKRRAVTH